jgi:integrase
MSDLRQALADYLKLRRAVGYKLQHQEQLLNRFLTYLEAHGQERITIEHAVAWATLPGCKQFSQYNRLLAVRSFARHLHTIDPTVEVLAANLLPSGKCRAVPYLYTDQQIAALIAAAGTLRTPHRIATYQILIGLLAATGMRAGEAITLDLDDIDWHAGVIVVRGAKFGKSRELPLHTTTIQALHRYLQRHDRPHSPEGTEAVFVSMAGSRLFIGNVDSTFRILRERAAIKGRSNASRAPRLHDLRHTFAVRTLLDAYRAGEDVQPRVALLSTYLGHADPADTHWYLQAAPELLALAGQRLEGHLQGASRWRSRPNAPGVLHRPAHRPAPSQPAHDRCLPRHASPATRLRGAARRHRTRRARPGPARRATDSSVPRLSGARARMQRPHPQRASGRRSARSTVTPRCTTPSTPRQSNGDSRYHPSASSPTSSRSSPRTSSTPCSTHRIARPGQADATTRSSCSRRKQGCAPQRSSVSPAAMSTWARVRTSPVSARAASSGSRL